MPTQLDVIQAVKDKKPDGELASLLKSYFSAEDLAAGKSIASYLGDFVWAIQSSSEPNLYVDDKPAAPMRKLAGTDLWVHNKKLLEGWAHATYYRIDGKAGERIDKAALTEDSYPKPGVPEGKMSDMMVHESPVYHGYKISWWVYASPGVDPATPAPVMIWHDGHRFLQRDMRDRLPVVTENLVQQKKIPPMVHILLSPTVVDDPVNGPYTPETRQRSLRSLLYDSVNDTYNHMVFGEIYPKVETMYKLRHDGYSTGTCGQSSGGICAFNMGWQRPEQVSRVLSRIGTYTSIQWRHGQDNPNHFFGFHDPAGFLDGGNIYPFMIRKWPQKNLRVYLSDGSYDLENDHGSWPMQAIQMANSLKMKEYDFKFTFGNSQHNTEQGEAELPMAMTWLWRGYDPAKTEETYQMDPDEKDKPYFRVAIVNR